MIDDYITLYETLESVLEKLTRLDFEHDCECDPEDGYICPDCQENDWKVGDLAQDIADALASVRRVHWSEKLESAS